MVNAIYFDGHSARQQPVTLCVAQGLLQVHGEQLLREEPLASLRITAKLGSAPRLLYFVGGGHCEVNDQAGLEALLREAGLIPQSLLSRMESSWRHALSATVISITVVCASFYWGLPWIASMAAGKVPAGVALTMDKHFLSAIDEGLTQASKLGKARKAQLTKRFDTLHDVNGLPPHHLEFRGSEALGANAFALPGGTVIVTDQLVALASNDEEVLAVLAHELGHVSERHPLRQLLQSTVVGLAMTWYVGDVSTLLAAAPTVLLETSYSRDFERRADRYAANMLRANGIAPARLADMLEKLESSHRDKISKRDAKQHASKGTKQNTKDSDNQYSRFSEILSTHPDTAERIRDLRSGDVK